MKKSIIGKNYIPNDTSYSINLSYPTRDVRLAGSSNPMNGEILENPKECKIVSEPYEIGRAHV